MWYNSFSNYDCLWRCIVPVNYSKRNRKVQLKGKVIWGSILIFVCALLGLNAMLGVFNPLNRLMLGSIGVLYFVLLICGIIEGVLLIVDKKVNIYYIREAIVVSLWVFFFALLIHQITILKLDDSSFGKFLADTYNYKFSLGGALFSIILYPIYAFCGSIGSFVILSCVLCVITTLFIIMIYQNVKEKKGDLVATKQLSAKASTALNSVSNEKVNEDKKFGIDDDIFIEDEDDKTNVSEKENVESNTQNIEESQPVEDEKTKKERILEILGLRKKTRLTDVSSTEPIYKETSDINQNVETFFNENKHTDSETQQSRPRKFVHDESSAPKTIAGKRILSEKDRKNLEFLRATQGKLGEIKDDDDYIVQQDSSVFDNREDIYDENVTEANYKKTVRPKFQSVDEDIFANKPSLNNSTVDSSTSDNSDTESDEDQGDMGTWQTKPQAGSYDQGAMKGIDRVTPKVKYEKVSEEKAYELAHPKKKKYVYNAPPIDLLNKIEIDPKDKQEDFQASSAMLENTLSSFKIDAKVVNITRGPAFTRYELAMPEGVPVKKVLTYQDDISMRLQSQGEVRLQIPIPGKNTFGVEVPNKHVDLVPLRDILESFAFVNSKSPLTFGLGKDITGEAKISRVDKLTHVLIAGTTGSGKSVCLNSILISIIYKSSPEDVKMLLIDPKRVEFTPYNGIPHLIIPEVICDIDKAICALHWAVDEMERRYNKFQEQRVRKIDEYNNCDAVRSGVVEKMPYLLILIDEVGDIMAQDKKNVEGYLQRLLQKSRACGIHIVLATQRPSADVITGVIKTNLPSRIAFQVSSAVDSRIIINQTGAEKLMGKGDMLYQSADSSELVRIQGAFLSDKEIQDVVDYVKEHNEVDFDPEIEEEMFKQNGGSGHGDGDISDYDPLFKDVLRQAIRSGKISISGIQRSFGLGYPRAGKIYDQLIKAGYIEPDPSSKNNTKILITQLEFEEKFGEDL